VDSPIFLPKKIQPSETVSRFVARATPVLPEGTHNRHSVCTKGKMGSLSGIGHYAGNIRGLFYGPPDAAIHSLGQTIDDGATI
jgi:hypothetical protein